MEFDERAEFYKKLECYYSSKPGKKPYTSDDINNMIQDILRAKTNRNKKTRHEYYLLDKYDVLEVDDKQHLISKRRVDDEIKYMVPYEELYERISDYHIQTGHGGNVKLRMAITKYAVPRPAIEAFLATCVVCNYKKGTKRKLAVKPIVVSSGDFNEKGQIDLVDFRSTPDGKFKWILIYQDHGTKFLSLRPLESNEPSEVATALLSIFLTFGAPKIVQSGDNGNGFLDAIITELNQLWPDCVIVCAQSTRQPPNGGVVSDDENIEGLLRAWMVDNKSAKWSVGLPFVQFRKNSSFNCLVGGSPYKALFGNDPKIGLNISNLSLEILHRMFKDGELENIRDEMSAADRIKTTVSRCSVCGLDDPSNAAAAADDHHSDGPRTVCDLCRKIEKTRRLAPAAEQNPKANVSETSDYEVEDHHRS